MVFSVEAAHFHRKVKNKEVLKSRGVLAYDLDDFFQRCPKMPHHPKGPPPPDVPLARLNF